MFIEKKCKKCGRTHKIKFSDDLLPTEVIKCAISNLEDHVKHCECRLELFNRAISFGKNINIYYEFINSCENNKSIEYHHTKYVAMSRERYEDLIAKSHKGMDRIIIDECVGDIDMDINSLNRIINKK